MDWEALKAEAINQAKAGLLTSVRLTPEEQAMVERVTTRMTTLGLQLTGGVSDAERESLRDVVRLELSTLQAISAKHAVDAGKAVIQAATAAIAITVRTAIEALALAV